MLREKTSDGGGVGLGYDQIDIFIVSPGIFFFFSFSRVPGFSLASLFIAAL